MVEKEINKRQRIPIIQGVFQMKKSFLLTLGLVLICFLTNGTVLADETMDRVAKTGKIRIGWQKDEPPFAFQDKITGQYAGLSVDLANFIVNLLSEHLGKKISIETQITTSQNRIAMLTDNKIDMDMGSISINIGRTDKLDYSIFYFFSDTAFMTPKDSLIRNVTELNGKKIGVLKNSHSLRAINAKIEQEALQPAVIVEVENFNQGLADLTSGKTQVYCSDYLLLERLRRETTNPAGWQITNFSIAYEPYACLIRGNNGDFRTFLNNAIIWSIKTGKYYEIYDKWMGTQAVKEMRTSSQKIRQTAIQTLTIIIGSTIVLIIFLVFLFGRRLTGNIKYLSGVADRISVGELDVEIKVASKDEIGELALAIARMQDSLRLSLDRLRRRK
jgi:ABC-type amino acid transport substrate-binding protein/HAMP domain-containing protein